MTTIVVWGRLLKDIIHLIGGYFQSQNELMQLDFINKHWYKACQSPLTWKNAITSSRTHLSRAGGVYSHIIRNFNITTSLPQLRILTTVTFANMKHLPMLCPNLTLLDITKFHDTTLPDFTLFPNLTALRLDNLDSDRGFTNEMLQYLLKTMTLLSVVNYDALSQHLKFEVPGLQWLSIDCVPMSLVQNSLSVYSKNLRELTLNGFDVTTSKYVDVAEIEKLQVDQNFPFLCCLYLARFNLTKEFSAQVSRLRYLQELDIFLDYDDKTSRDYLFDLLSALKDSLQLFRFHGGVGDNYERLFSTLAALPKLVHFQIIPHEIAMVEKRMFCELFRNHPALLFANISLNAFDLTMLHGADKIWWNSHVFHTTPCSDRHRFLVDAKNLALVKQAISASSCLKSSIGVNFEDNFIVPRGMYSSWQQLLHWNRTIRTLSTPKTDVTSDTSKLAAHGTCGHK